MHLLLDVNLNIPAGVGDVVLGMIIGTLCAVVGLIGPALIGYHALLLFGVPAAGRRAAKWSVLAFGLPGALAGFVVGYRLGSNVAYDHTPLRSASSADVCPAGEIRLMAGPVLRDPPDLA